MSSHRIKHTLQSSPSETASHRRYSLKNAVLTNFVIFRKTPVLDSLFKKAAGLQAYNFIKKRHQHRYFLANIRKFLRTPILKKTSANGCLSTLNFFVILCHPLFLIHDHRYHSVFFPPLWQLFSWPILNQYSISSIHIPQCHLNFYVYVYVCFISIWRNIYPRGHRRL